MRLHRPEALERRRRLIETGEFDSALKRLRSDVEALERAGLRAPAMRAGYYHDYFCPEHAVELEFDSLSPLRHRCPVDGKIHTGERTSAAWRWFVNHNQYMLALKAAVLGTLTSDARPLEVARAVLLDYAERYPSYEPDPGYGFSGRACFHGLDEAVMTVHLAWAFDLAWPDGRDEGAARTVERLLVPAAEWILGRRRERIHNIECWLNAAVASCAALCDRPDMLSAALEPPYGFSAQLGQGVLGDGMWYEGTLSYHFYTLAALIWTARACEAARPGLARPPELERMLLAPLKVAHRDLTLPSTNDCWYPIDLVHRCGHGIPDPPAFYEVAMAWYEKAEFASVLAAAYERRPRDSVEALLFGSAEGLGRPFGPAKSELLADSGFAALRRGANQVSLKYGPHGGPHGHFDKLGISVFGAGRSLSPDLGTPGYGIALNDTWYRHTASHNTVLVDGERQEPGEGRLIRYEDGERFQAADAEVRWTSGAYAGVRMRRAVLLGDEYILDLFLVEAERERVFEWIYHNRGALVRPRGEVPAERDHVLAHVDIRSALSVRADEFRWELDGAGSTVWLPPQREEERFIADGPFNPASETAPMLVRRFRGEWAIFVSVICPWEAGTAPPSAAFEGSASAGSAAIAIALPAGWERWEIALASSRRGRALKYEFASGRGALERGGL